MSWIFEKLGAGQGTKYESYYYELNSDTVAGVVSLADHLEVKFLIGLKSDTNR